MSSTLSAERRRAMLKTAMGPDIAAAFAELMTDDATGQRSKACAKRDVAVVTAALLLIGAVLLVVALAVVAINFASRCWQYKCCRQRSRQQGFCNWFQHGIVLPSVNASPFTDELRPI